MRRERQPDGPGQGRAPVAGAPHLVLLGGSRLRAAVLARAAQGQAVLLLLPVPQAGVLGLARPLALRFVGVAMATGLERKGAAAAH